jgi:large subunit ribosomal protein L23
MMVNNKYLFRVTKEANKIEVKKAVEEIYKVKVDSVNIMNVRGKKKRVRFREGMTSSWKKAIVTLEPDNRIEVT